MSILSCFLFRAIFKVTIVFRSSSSSLSNHIVNYRHTHLEILKFILFYTLCPSLTKEESTYIYNLNNPINYSWLTTKKMVKISLEQNTMIKKNHRDLTFVSLLY